MKANLRGFEEVPAVIGPAGQGLAAGELDEMIAASDVILAGAPRLELPRARAEPLASSSRRFPRNRP